MSIMLVSCSSGDLPIETAEPERPDNSVPSETTEPSKPSEPPEGTDQLDNEDSYKVAIFTDMRTEDPEIISILKAEEKYGDRIVRLTTNPEHGLYNDLSEWEELIGEVLRFIEDPMIRALIFVSAGNLVRPSEFLGGNEGDSPGNPIYRP